MIKKTKRLILRPLEQGDHNTWRESYLNNSPSKNIWDNSFRVESDLTKTKFSRLLKSQKNLRAKDKFYELAIFTKNKGEFIGSISAMDIVRSITHSGYLGYSLHNRHWGMGYGKEAVLNFIKFCFTDLKLHRIEAGIEPNNRRSIFLARSIGLRKEGLKKRVVFLRGQWQDLTMYSATCEDFGIKWKQKVLR